MHLSNVDLIYRGKNRGYLQNYGDKACPNEMGYDWMFNPGSKCGGVWTDAGYSLTINCV